MLAAMQASGAHVSMSSGLDQLWVRRNLIDGATGEPTDELGNREHLLNPNLGYFAAASFYTDPVAIGLGIYDLSSRYRFRSTEALRYHMAPDPDFGDDSLRASDRIGGCLLAQESRCPPNGGNVEYRHDFTVAVGWNAGALQLGAAVHMPTVRSRFAFDNDTSLAGSDDGADPICDAREQPGCAERVGFKGYNHWLQHGEAESGFDVALTLGAAYTFANKRVTLGGRYRTFPLRRRGKMISSGVGLVCLPDPLGDGDIVGDVAPCSRASTITATLTQRLPQSVALGGSFVLGSA
jgi:hypothetical protein